MDNLYLAHHGVKGMKWGVRRDRRKAARAAYKKELANPGSQSEKAVSTKRMRRGRVLNFAGAVVLGKEAVGDALGLGMLGVSSANALALGYPAATVGLAAMPMAIGFAGVGAAAGYGAYKLAKRYEAANESVQIREAKASK